MAEGSFVAYYRVSTDRQGRSGIGLEAQRAAVAAYLNGGRWTLGAEFTEVESGKNADRPQLAAAFKAARLYGAKLVIAKLDRLSRDAHFLLGLEKAGVDFVAADMPFANRLTVGIMALVADEERRMISRRTKEALAMVKARGHVLGGRREAVRPGKLSLSQRADVLRSVQGMANAVRLQKSEARARDLAPVIADLRARGVESLNALARALTERGIPTARGKAEWTPMQVSRVLQRIGAG
jgi:DNA invertase Pin-like site-specific DNA recombinase